MRIGDWSSDVCSSDLGGFPMRRLLTVLLLAASPLPYVSAAAQTETAATALLEVPRINFTKRVLSNGATVYAIRDTSTATVSINIWYDVDRKSTRLNSSH